MSAFKKIAIALGVVLLIILIGNWGINVYVNKKVPALISEKNKTPYLIAYDTLEVAVWAGHIKAKGIRISPRSAIKDTIKKQGIYAKIQSIEIEHFKLWDILFNDKIKANSITINAPELLLYKKTEKAIDNAKSIGSEVVKPFQQIVAVSEIYLNRGNVKIIYAKNNKPILSAANIKVELKGIVITDDILKRKIPFSYKQYAFSCDSVYYKSNPVYHIKANTIQTENNGFSLKDFEMVPDVTRKQFVASLPKEKDLYALKAASIDIKNMDWGFKEEQFFFNAGSVTLDKVAANIYRSKVPADDLSKKKLYNKLLRDMKFPLKVDTLSVKNSLLQYEEEINFEKGPGLVAFHKFNLTAFNLQSGFGQTEMPDLRIRINCLFMNTSPMKVNWRLNVLDKTDGFNIKGSILNFDTKKLTVFTKPYINIKQEGVFDEVYFNFTGNDVNAKGDFALKYHDLKVAIYKKKHPEKKNKIVSALANLLVKNDSDGETKNAEVELKRIPEKSFYNFFWRSIQEGLKKILI